MTVTINGTTGITTPALDSDGTIKLDGNYPVGTDNVALGNAALDSLTTGGYNVAIGSNAGTAITTGGENTALGSYAMISSTTAANSTAVGYAALGNAVTTGGSNTAVGRYALRQTTSGASNTALGNDALLSNTTASNNTAVGYQAGYLNTTGTRNLASGNLALYSNTTGDNNTALGSQSLQANTTAINNTSVGYASLNNNTTGASNVAVGKFALLNNTTASYNTAVGFEAGYSNQTGAANVFVGENAGYFNTNQHNTFLGAGAGYFVTSGQKNTLLGRYNGNQHGLDIRTSNNNIVLSDGDGNPRGYYYSGGWHLAGDDADDYGLAVSNSNGTRPYGLRVEMVNGTNNTSEAFIVCADNISNRMVTFSNGNIVNVNNSYGALSDVKLKENIVDASSQWDDIKNLTVRKYSLKLDNLDAPNMIGVIAQEVEAAGMAGLVFESQDKDQQNKDLGTVTKQVNYSILYMKAVKALQEAMTRIETLEAKVTALEGN